jgi:hypothetical protein
MLRTIDDEARALAWIGHVTTDQDWIDNQWASIEPETYAKVAEAIADHDTAQAGQLIKDAMTRIAYREAKTKFKVTLP